MRKALTAVITAAVCALVCSPTYAVTRAEITTITATTDAGGDATVFSHVIQNRVIYISYQGGLDATADFTITCEESGEGLWDEDDVSVAKIVAPSKAIQDQDGVDRAQFDYIWCIGRIEIVIAQGGNTKTAVFEIAHF